MVRGEVSTPQCANLSHLERSRSERVCGDTVLCIIAISQVYDRVKAYTWRFPTDGVYGVYDGVYGVSGPTDAVSCLPCKGDTAS